MRVVNFDEFANMPEGTIFSMYEPCIPRDLCRKGQTIIGNEGLPIDFFMESLMPKHLWDDDGFNVLGLGGVERWGEFDDNVLYIIYEAEDLLKIKNLLGFD